MRNDIRPGLTRPQEKWAELRSRTDRDLAALLRAAIQRGFQAVHQGDAAMAELEYAHAARLLPLARTLPAQELQRVEIELGELRAEMNNASSLQPLAG